MTDRRYSIANSSLRLAQPQTRPSITAKSAESSPPSPREAVGLMREHIRELPGRIALDHRPVVAFDMQRAFGTE